MINPAIALLRKAREFFETTMICPWPAVTIKHAGRMDEDDDAVAVDLRFTAGGHDWRMVLTPPDDRYGLGRIELMGEGPDITGEISENTFARIAERFARLNVQQRQLA